MVPLIPIPNKLAKLIAPFDGTVTDTCAQPGDRVSVDRFRSLDSLIHCK
ncbi:MAG: hypothetical protein PVJ21_15085 [Anaerolineales bacterium]